MHFSILAGVRLMIARHRGRQLRNLQESHHGLMSVFRGNFRERGAYSISGIECQANQGAESEGLSTHDVRLMLMRRRLHGSLGYL